MQITLELPEDIARLLLKEHDVYDFTQRISSRTANSPSAREAETQKLTRLVEMVVAAE